MRAAPRRSDFLLSIVIPCFNEEEVIQSTYDRVVDVLDRKNFRLQLVFVNDGSKDATGAILEAISTRDERVRVVTFARNFGHQAAVSAGLANAIGDAVVVIDADLQDPPEVILDMIERWLRGFDVVYGIRTKRKEAAWKRLSYSLFYRIFRKIASIDAPLDAGDFSLIDKRVLSQINQLPEKNRFYRGLRAWVGFNQIGVAYEREPRAAGVTKYPFFKLIKLAADGIFNFSTVPLTIVFYLGLLMFLFSFSLGVLIFSLRIFNLPIFGVYIINMQGFASTILIILLIGGIQLISIGVVGEYIGRIYQEVKSRPTYVVREQSSLEQSEERLDSLD